MNQELGIVLVEEEQGNVAVQLFKEPRKAEEIFRQLNDPRKLRATFITVDWGKRKVEAMVKETPENSEKMDHWEIGKGPIPIKSGISQ